MAFGAKKLKTQAIYFIYGPSAEPEACLVRCAQTAASSPCGHGRPWGPGMCRWVAMGAQGRVARWRWRPGMCGRAQASREGSSVPVGDARLTLGTQRRV